MNIKITSEIPDDPDERRELRETINTRLATIEHADSPSIEAERSIIEIEREALEQALAEIEEHE